MADKADISGSDSPEGVHNLQPSGDAPVSLPEGFGLAEAAFERSDEDIVLTDTDGTRVKVEGYFAADPPPALLGSAGAQISGAVAERLAGPLQAGQVIQAGTDSANEAIGTVSTVSGKAFVIRLDGTREEVDIDTVLYAGDIIETTSDGAVGFILADETTVAMGDDGRMVLDEMIYDPGTQEGSLSLFAIKGLYAVISGLVAKTDPDAMVIDTPVGSIGIRGTQIGIDFTDGENLTLVMMREADGYVGEVFLRNEGGFLVMNQVNQVLFSNTIKQAPVVLASVSDDTIIQMFESTLLHLPQTTENANDYGTQESSGGGELDSFVTESGPSEEIAEQEVPPPEDTIIVAGSDTSEPAPTIEPVTAASVEPEVSATDETDLATTTTETRPEDQVSTAQAASAPEPLPVEEPPPEEEPPAEEPPPEEEPPTEEPPPEEEPPTEEPPPEEEPPTEEPPPEEPPPEEPGVVLKGKGGEDVLYGGGGDDVLKGGGGGDVLHGGGGDDLLKGEGGEDVLYGGAGNDLLRGEGGEDVLSGGAGDDVLKGGGGDDTFVFESDAGKDIILDYHEGEVLRFEGPEFSEQNISVTQNGDNVSIMFGGQDVEVTLNDVNLSDQGYTVTQEEGAVIVTFDDDK